VTVPVAHRPPKRRLRTLVVGGTRAAFGIGAGYEPQRVSEQACFEPTRVSAYFVDLRAKTLREEAAFASGRSRVHGVSPTTRAQRALGWWDRQLAGDPGALIRFLAAAEELVRAGERDERGLLWRYDVEVPKYGRRAPWYSCMAQGQAASVLVRAAQATGRKRWAEAAVAAIAPLLAGAHGIVRPSDAGPVLEECPSEPPSAILNGWIFGLWGLWDVAVELGHPQAMTLFEASSETLLQGLPEYDLGWWSRYSLYPGHVDVATPFYHRAHVSQLDVMHRLTGRPELAEALARWRAYDRPTNRARALLTKVRYATARPAVDENAR